MGSVVVEELNRNAVSGEAAVSSSLVPAGNAEPDCWRSAGEPLDGNTSKSL